MVRVVKPNIHNVEPRCYYTVRSFLDSPEDDSYPWNVGVLVGNTAYFEKAGKWLLVTSCGEVDRAVLLSWDKYLAAMVIKKAGQVEDVMICGDRFSKDDLLGNAIVYANASPILLKTVVDKIVRYLNATRRFLSESASLPSRPRLFSSGRVPRWGVGLPIYAWHI